MGWTGLFSTSLPASTARSTADPVSSFVTEPHTNGAPTGVPVDTARSCMCAECTPMATAHSYLAASWLATAKSRLRSASTRSAGGAPKPATVGAAARSSTVAPRHIANLRNYE